MNFYKIISALIITLSVFSSNSYSMLSQEEEDNRLHIPYRAYTQSADVEITDDLVFTEEVNELRKPGIEVDLEKQRVEESCAHWGLSHWFSGIGEYIQTCLCCKVDKTEGLYRHTIESNTYFTFSSIGRQQKPSQTVVISDCYFNYFNTSYSNPRSCEKAFCCFPFAAITHLCCLPCACYKVSESAPEEIFHAGASTYIPPIDGPEEKRIKARAAARSALESKHSVCIKTICVHGQPALCPKRN